MRIGASLLAATLLATPVAAQSLKLPTAAFMAAATADWTTTHRAMSRGIGEGDPLVAWAGTPNRVVATGVALQAVGYALAYRLLAEKHRRLFAIGLYAMSAYQTVAAIQNTRYTQTVDAMRLYFHVNALRAPR